MRVLVACESSGRIRDAFLALGYEAVSCDVAPGVVRGPHFIGDVRELLEDGWDLVIATPEFPEDAKATAAGVALIQDILNCSVPYVAVATTSTICSLRMRDCDQVITPLAFGDDEVRPTRLWLKRLHKLDAGQGGLGLAEAMAEQWGGPLFCGTALWRCGNM